MKYILLLTLLWGQSLYSSENSQKEIEALKERIQELEKKSGGLKVKDYKNTKMYSNGSQGSSSDNVNQLSTEDQKKLQQALKKGEKYLKERNKYLKELENED